MCDPTSGGGKNNGGGGNNYGGVYTRLNLWGPLKGRGGNVGSIEDTWWGGHIGRVAKEVLEENTSGRQ